ncbi:nucleotidyltransferase domain-containing protein [Sinomicrobium sp. M5D2P9]
MDPEILQYILSEWSTDKECLGILLCGSYAYGMQTEYSDIDLRIIYNNYSIKAGKAGVKTFRGKTLFFREDTEHVFYSTMHSGIRYTNRFQARNFALGRILYEKDTTLQYLKKEAQFLMQKKFPDINVDRLQYLLYHIWYNCDKVLFLPENDPFFQINYYSSLFEIFKNYSEIIRTEIISEHKLSSFLFSSKFRKNYCIENFPDKEFINLWIKALNTIDKNYYKTIYNYIVKQYPETNLQNFRISMINN